MKWWTCPDWLHDLQMIAMMLRAYPLYRELLFYNLKQLT